MFKKTTALSFYIFILFHNASALAVQFVGSQTGPDEWTYDLTYDPLDNYGICTDPVTITITGVSGVTQAFGPTSTDYVPAGGPSDLENLMWAPQVLNGGTMVRWTGTGWGTGNTGTQHVYGFRIIAPGATNVSVTAQTSGFERDAACPSLDLDISTSVAGPAAPSSAPVPSAAQVPALGPVGLLSLLILLPGVAIRALRRK